MKEVVHSKRSLTRREKLMIERRNRGQRPTHKKCTPKHPCFNCFKCVPSRLVF